MARLLYSRGALRRVQPPPAELCCFGEPEGPARMPNDRCIPLGMPARDADCLSWPADRHTAYVSGTRFMRSPRLTGAADALHSGTAIQRELLEGVRRRRLVELLALGRALRRRYRRDGLVLGLVRRFLRLVGEGVKVVRPLAELVLVALGLGVLLRDTTDMGQSATTNEAERRRVHDRLERP